MIPMPGSATALIFAGIIAAGAVIAWRTITGQQEEIGKLTERLETAEAQVVNTRNLVDAKTKQINTLARRIEQADRERSKLAQHLSERQAYITRMESTDENFKAWADSRLPNGACRVLQFPPDPNNNHSMPDCGTAGDASAAPSANAYQPQQALARPD